MQLGLAANGDELSREADLLVWDKKEMPTRTPTRIVTASG